MKTSISIFVFISIIFSCSDSDSALAPANEVLETIMDIDGNPYGVIKIGDQQWMNLNLKTTKYNDGTPIEFAPGFESWDSASDFGVPSYSYLDNDESFIDDLGMFYNFYAVDPMYNGGKNICPQGWHIPSLDEWNDLRLFIDPNGSLSNNTAGGCLMETSDKYWNDENTHANNKFGFTARAAGDRSGSSSLFGDFKRTAIFWTATAEEGPDSFRAHYVTLTKGIADIDFLVPKIKGMGYSCRCMKN